MTMMTSALSYYRRLTIAFFTACVIIVGSTATAAFNNPSSLLLLPLPPQPLSSSSSSSSARRLSSRGAHSTPKHEILGYHQYHNHRLIGRRIGSNSIKEEFEFGTVALFASAYNDETTTAATRTGDDDAAAAITTDAITSTAAVATATTISSPTVPISSTLVLDDSAHNYRVVQDDTTTTTISVGSDNSGKEIIQSSSISIPISSHHLIAPSIPKILRYTIPAIGIWLCSPVLSMIDTASVGLLSGTAQQAALNPAASVTDCGALVVAFMYTATTNLIAAAVREDEDEHEQRQLEEEELEQLSDMYSLTTTTTTSNTPTTTTTTNYETRQNVTTRRHQPKTTKTLITALKLALLVGTTFAITLMSTAPHLLQLLMGENSASSLDQQAVVYSAALRYVRIRALGMPAMVVIGTAQSACLGMQDVRSPLYVLLAAAVINFLGDVALVPLKSPLWGGAAGAAWATVASQYAALIFFARWLTMKKSDGNTTTIGSNGAGRRRRKTPQFWKRRRKEGMMTTTTTAAEMIANHVSIGLEVSDPLPSIATSAPTATTGVRAIDEGNNNHLRNDSEMQQTSHQALSPEQTKSQTKIRSFLSDSKLTPRTFLSVHNLDTNKVKEFFPFVIPVTTTSIGRISGYIAMSHVAASTLGTFDMAAHQIILSIFCCITPFVDALSQVAQSFVPAVFEAKERGQERADALRKTVTNFRLVGLGFGGVLVSLVACIPLISRYFTTDLVVLERVHSAIAPVGLFMLVNGLMCAGEGTLLGQKDLKFLRNMYAIFFFTVPAYMLRLKHRALIGLQTVGVATMWTAFSMYNVIRASSFHLRLAQLQRRTDRGVTGNEDYKVKEIG